MVLLCRDEALAKHRQVRGATTWGPQCKMSTAALQVFCKGGEPVGDKPKVLKTKLWQEVVPQLTVKGRKPCHKDDPLCTKSGGCTIPDDVPDGSTIS